MNAPPISMPALKLFRRIVRGYFRRHFCAVHLSGASEFVHDGEPLIVYANHSSWWDPMVSILLAEQLMPTHMHYAPMDEAALSHYKILKKVGVFPVEIDSPRGAAQFLRTSAAVLEDGGVLWVTPQGQFVDARCKPLVFKPGLAVLAVRTFAAQGACTVLPLAIEYPFWNERLPEVLLRFGVPVRVQAGESADSLNVRLVAALDATMSELREMAVGRSADAFETLLQGKFGVGGFYALGKRLRAIVSRQPYEMRQSVTGNNEISRGREDA